MIGYLEGIPQHTLGNLLVLNVNGVGYEITLPESSSRQIDLNDKPFKLWIHTHVKEDALQLYGFTSLAEREMFRLLISCSGVGPKLAMAMLSSISVENLQRAVLSQDTDTLASIPGIGKKTAQRLVLELKDKFSKRFPSTLSSLLPSNSTVHRTHFYEDAISALMNLGYPQSIAEKTIRDVHHSHPNVGLESLLKHSLKALAQGNKNLS